MFEVKVFCEDKKLPELLWALDGKIVGMPQLLPVRDAKPSKDGSTVVATAPARQKKFEAFYEALKRKEIGAKITMEELQGFVTQTGGARTSAYNYVRDLLENKILKRVDKGLYQIVNLPTEVKTFYRLQKEKKHG